MRKIAKVLLGTCLLFILTSCQEVPEEILNENKTVETLSNSPEEVSQKKFDTLENIYMTMDDVLKQHYDNLVIDRKFNVNKPEKVYELECTQFSDYEDHKQELLDYFFKDNIDPTYIDEKGTTLYDNKKTGAALSLKDNGFFFYAERDSDNLIDMINRLEDYSVYETIYFQEEYENSTYQYKDKSITTEELKEKAQNYVDKVSSSFDSLKWNVSSLSAIQNKEGEFLFEFRFTKSYKDTNFFYRDYRGSSKKLSNDYVTVFQPLVVINMDGKVLAVDNYPGLMDCKEKKEIDKIVTLQYGLSSLSKILSSYKTYRIRSISLEYALILCGEPKEDVNMFNDWTPGNVYDAKPYWLICFNNDPDNQQFAMIHCDTGDIDFVPGR